jgi:hypothetical protein
MAVIPIGHPQATMGVRSRAWSMLIISPADCQLKKPGDDLLKGSSQLEGGNGNDSLWGDSGMADAEPSAFGKKGCSKAPLMPG